MADLRPWRIVVITSLFFLGVFSLNVCAVDSPVPIVYHNITFYNGSYDSLNSSVPSTNNITYTIDQNRASTFQNWTFFKSTGADAEPGTDFTFISGDANSQSITIHPMADLLICANYDVQIIPQQPKKKMMVKSSGSPSSEPKLTQADYFRWAIMLSGFVIGCFIAFLFLDNAFGGSQK